MAKTPKTRHSGTTRKSVVIHHEPIEEKTPDAEPVLMVSACPPSNDKEMPDQMKDTSQANLEENTGQGSIDDIKIEEIQPMKKIKKGSSFLGGVAGGILTVLVVGGLQWAGILPPFNSFLSMQSSNDAALKTKTGLNDEDRARINEAWQMAQAADKAAKEIKQAAGANLSAQPSIAPEQLAALKAEIDDIKQSLRKDQSSIKIDGAESVVADRAIGSEINTINNRVLALSSSVDALQALASRLDAVEGKVRNIDTISQMAEQSIMQNNRNKQEIESLSSVVQASAKEVKASGNNMAPLIAANSLKAAIDRGGSFVNELKTFEMVAPEGISLAPLKDIAANGIPNIAELSAQFASVADKIAATENAVPETAGWGQKVWGTARGWISSRPVGDIEGETPGAIAARMEVAIKAGDFDKALGEWDKLPENAKAVSTDFITLLKARSNIDRLLSSLVARSLHVEHANNDAVNEGVGQ